MGWTGRVLWIDRASWAFQEKVQITLTANGAECSFHLFVFPGTKFTDCDRVKDKLTEAPCLSSRMTVRQAR